MAVNEQFFCSVCGIELRAPIEFSREEDFYCLPCGIQVDDEIKFEAHWGEEK